MRILPGKRHTARGVGTAVPGQTHAASGHRRNRRRHGKTPGQIILRWHIQKGHIAIPKSSNESRIHENGDVFSFILTPDDMDRIDALDCGEHIGDDPYTFTGSK